MALPDELREAVDRLFDMLAFMPADGSVSERIHMMGRDWKVLVDRTTETDGKVTFHMKIQQRS